VKNDPEMNGKCAGRLGDPLLLLFGAIAIAGIALVVWGLAEIHREQARKDESAVAMDKLFEVAQLNFLVRNISAGNSDEAKQLLADKLKNDLIELHSSLPNTDDSTQYLGCKVFNSIVRTERKHPEFYLTPPELAQARTGDAWAQLGVSH
jgi:hypothetical protein